VVVVQPKLPVNLPDSAKFPWIEQLTTHPEMKCSIEDEELMYRKINNWFY